MDILAKLLDDKLKFTEIAYSIEDVEKIAISGKIPIMICSAILKDKDPFKHSWDVTSDSIAAYIASLFDANLLIATDVDGIFTDNPNKTGAKLINKIDVNELLSFNETSIDLMLPSLLIDFGLNCYVVNGKFPKRVLSILTEDNDDFPHTFICNYN